MIIILKSINKIKNDYYWHDIIIDMVKTSTILRNNNEYLRNIKTVEKIELNTVPTFY